MEEKPKPFNKEAEQKIKDLGWIEEKSSDDEVLEMINHIKNNEALLDEIKEKMKKSGEKNLEKALRKYAEQKITQHKETEEGVKERYSEPPKEF